MIEFNPDNNLPAWLEGKIWLTYEEFGSLAGVGEAAIRVWGKKGIVKVTKFTPHCNRIHISEVNRLYRGELMDASK